MVKVLVVDDFEPWFSLICSMLQKLPEVQIVGEVSDGLEAVQKAVKLQPEMHSPAIAARSSEGVVQGRRLVSRSDRKASPPRKRARGDE